MKQLIFYVATISFLFLGCKTTIPDRDSVNPTFTFFVRGNGINEQLEEDTFDFDNQVLYLTRGQTYTISLIGSDRGGCQSILWELQALPPIIEFPEPLPDSWTSSFTPTSFHQIVWVGNRSDIRTGHALATKIVPNGSTPNNVEEIETLIAVADYSGNEVRKLLTLRIHNEGPRIGRR